MSTENIKAFLQTAYTDEKLAALLAHAQDGKLSYNSCCCLIGIPTAQHSLKGNLAVIAPPLGGWPKDCFHANESREMLAWARDAEIEFGELGENDAERCSGLIPLILAEMERRELLRPLPDLPLSEQLRLEEEAAAEEGAAIEASNYPDPAENVRFA